jgi:hypothetical protein
MTPKIIKYLANGLAAFLLSILGLPITRPGFWVVTAAISVAITAAYIDGSQH